MDNIICNCVKGGEQPMTYERPEILATYTEEELVAEAAVCQGYNPPPPPPPIP